MYLFDFIHVLLAYDQIGYLTFGDHVGSNIIAMYPPTSLIIAIGRLGIVLLVGLSYPLQLLPCRACVYAFTSGIVKGKKHVPILVNDDSLSPRTARRIADAEGESEDDDEEDDLLVPKQYHDGRGIGPGEMRNSKFVGFTTGILLAGFMIALAVDELEVGKFCIGLDVDQN